MWAHRRRPYYLGIPHRDQQSAGQSTSERTPECHAGFVGSQRISKSIKCCGTGREFWTVDRASEPAVELYHCGGPQGAGVLGRAFGSCRRWTTDLEISTRLFVPTLQHPPPPHTRAQRSSFQNSGTPIPPFRVVPSRPQVLTVLVVRSVCASCFTRRV